MANTLSYYTDDIIKNDNFKEIKQHYQYVKKETKSLSHSLWYISPIEMNAVIQGLPQDIEKYYKKYVSDAISNQLFVWQLKTWLTKSEYFGKYLLKLTDYPQFCKYMEFIMDQKDQMTHCFLKNICNLAEHSADASMYLLKELCCEYDLEGYFWKTIRHASPTKEVADDIINALKNNKAAPEWTMEPQEVMDFCDNELHLLEETINKTRKRIVRHGYKIINDFIQEHDRGKYKISSKDMLHKIMSSEQYNIFNLASRGGERVCCWQDHLDEIFDLSEIKNE